MDPNSQSFIIFANQLPGYCKPTPDGTNTIYHQQAGDLYTPGYGFGPSTSLSLPTSEGTLNAGHQVNAFHGFHAHLPQHVQHPAFQDIDPFQMQHQHGLPPHLFSHQPSLKGVESALGKSPIEYLKLDAAIRQQHHASDMAFQSHSMHRAVQPPLVHPSGEKFRHHVTLNAPTAMVQNSDETPVTYLNKGQAYTLTVVDTHYQQASPTRYRTLVRVSFEDAQQRLKPAACWQLWKEGRGINEAHQRGGRLQAVEYVESGQLDNAEDPSKPRIELESASFDGFCVVWSPLAGAAECPISVRFNFLSTDFSRSKGVKGIPVRLCAKTELLEGPIMEASSANAPELCYGRVKLFRDHGAERKSSNDVARVKKTIDKINQQIAQIESGKRDLGKRKRGSVAKGSTDERSGKVPKHWRTWSISSITSNGGRGSVEEDLHMKLMTLQVMFTSTRPVSVLYLPGEDLDDPDLYPVKLTGEPISLARIDTTDLSVWEHQSAQNGPPPTLVSSSPSSQSLAEASRRDSNLQQPTPIAVPSLVNLSQWRSKPQNAAMDLRTVRLQQLASPPEMRVVKIQSRSSSSGWAEATGVDPTYQRPAERAIKPVACFFVQPRNSGRSPTDEFHRAIYLMQRTLKDFTNALAVKCNFEPTRVFRTIRITQRGMHVLFDDECLRELPEGQDLTVEFHEIQPESPSKMTRDWEAGSTDVQCDGELITTQNTSATGYELRLLF
ncbi:hypothetical protein LTR49_027072 [Elasticomyces elasticus]|nr:hypothetical protein LTR49_027072 [Elasticomyces elasticus]